MVVTTDNKMGRIIKSTQRIPIKKKTPDELKAAVDAARKRIGARVIGCKRQVLRNNTVQLPCSTQRKSSNTREVECDFLR